MKVNVEYEVTCCRDCPYLKTGQSFGSDGRCGPMVYKCNKGAYGGIDEFGYSTGYYSIPKVPPYKCPLFNEEPMKRVASKLEIKVSKLERILEEENCELKEKCLNK